MWALLPREPRGTMRGSWTLQENKEKTGSSRKYPMLTSIPGAVLVTDADRRELDHVPKPLLPPPVPLTPFGQLRPMVLSLGVTTLFGVK